MHFSTAVSEIKHMSYPIDHLLAEMEKWDAMHYAERLPKKPSRSGTKALDEREASLRWHYPPPNDVMASTPCIIVDMQGIILTWYLSGILTDSRQVGLCLFTLCHCSKRKSDASQNSMLAAHEKLCPLLKNLPSGSS